MFRLCLRSGCLAALVVAATCVAAGAAERSVPRGVPSDSLFKRLKEQDKALVRERQTRQDAREAERRKKQLIEENAQEDRRQSGRDDVNR